MAAGTHSGYSIPQDIIWQFDYAIDVQKLRDLYSKAKKDQWNTEVDIDWDREIDPSKEIMSPGGAGNVQDSEFFSSLSQQQRESFSANMTAYILSQIMHGEQGAMMVAAHLVDCVPDYEGKLYAATQTMDEARHVEVFETYINRLGRVYPLDPQLKQVVDTTIKMKQWQSKLVAIQMILEGLALGGFVNTRRMTEDALLRDILELVIRDEARHVAFGNVYVRESLPDMHPDDRAEMEDFAFDIILGFGPAVGLRRNPDGDPMDTPNAFGMMAGFFEVIKDSGIDPNDFIRAMMHEFQGREGDFHPPQQPGQVDTFREIIMPSLIRTGVVGDQMKHRLREAGLPLTYDTTVLDKLANDGETMH